MKRLLKFLVPSLFTTTLVAACSQSAGLNGASGNSQGGGRSTSNSLDEKKSKDAGVLDANGALKETLKDGRTRLTYKGENQSVVAPVDIVFVIDTSGSMSEERLALEQNLTSFLTQIATAASNIDYYAWILASPFTAPTSANNKIEVLKRRVGSTDALSHLKDFLSGVGSPAPIKQLRDDSRKQIVIITDDDAKGVVATDIVELSTTSPKLLNKIAIHGIIGLVSGSVSKGCSIANIGTQYQALAAAPATKGIILDLCSNDWSKLLSSLAATIATDVRKSTFEISDRLDANKGLEVSVGGISVPVGGFTYDSATGKLTLGSAYAPAPDQELEIVYSPTN